MIDLEERYLVVKASHLNDQQIGALEAVVRENAIPTITGLVVEKDWPIYDVAAYMVVNQELFMATLGDLVSQIAASNEADRND